MNIWKVLDINPTEEISVIKKAYAKKLKVYHPEDDPQGYQMLREAFDNALRIAKNSQLNINGDTISIENVNMLPKQSEQENLPLSISYENCSECDGNRLFNTNDTKNIIYETSVNYELLVEEFFERAHALYSNFLNRIDEKNWEELLNDDIMWQLNYRELINRKMIEFLIVHPYLPENIWRLLNTNFHWDEQEQYLNSNYPSTFIKYLFRQIGRDRVLHYCYFDKNIEINFEEYLNYREKAFIALCENDLKSAEQYISLAYAIYSRDPELLCMQGDYYLRVRDKKKSSAAFKAGAKINPNDMDIYFYQAQIMYKNERFKKAIKICNFIQTHSSNKFEIHTLKGKCYLNIGKWHKASKLFLGNLYLKPSDVETRKDLKQLASQLRTRLQKEPFNFILIHDLNEIYRSLGETKNIERMRITTKRLLQLLTSFPIIIIILIFAVIVTGKSYIPFTVLLISSGYRGYKRRSVRK